MSQLKEKRCTTKIYMGKFGGVDKNYSPEKEYFFRIYLDEQHTNNSLAGKTVRLVNAEMHEEWKQREKCHWYGKEGVCILHKSDQFGGDSGEGRCGRCTPGCPHGPPRCDIAKYSDPPTCIPNPGCATCVHRTPPSISGMTMPYLRQLGYMEKYQKTDGKDGKRIWDNLLERSIKS